MRKGLILSVLVTVLCFAPAFAKAEQLGMYVTPKFIYGAAIMDNTKIHKNSVMGSESFEDTFKISSGSDSVYGGAIAFGYDFHERFKLPLRAEVEYSLFSKAKNKASTGYSDEGSSYSYSERGEQSFGVQTVFANAYYDFHNSSAFTPYIGGGLGVAFINTKAKRGHVETYDGTTAANSENWSTSSKTRSNFAWNLGLGVTYDFTENIALDLSYRFAGLGSVKTKTSSWEGEDETLSLRGKTQDLYMHQVGVGIKFSF